MSDRLVNLLGATALAASDRLRAAVEQGLAHGGATPAALVHLCAYPGQSVEALRRVLRISQPAAVRLVDGLVAEGLAERRPGPDRRTLALFLTAAGRRAAHRALTQRAASLREVLTPLNAEEQTQLLSLLEKLAPGLAADRGQALTVCRLCDREACCQEAGCPLGHTVAVDSPAREAISRPGMPT